MLMDSPKASQRMLRPVAVEAVVPVANGVERVEVLLHATLGGGGRRRGFGGDITLGDGSFDHWPLPPVHCFALCVVRGPNVCHST